MADFQPLVWTIQKVAINNALPLKTARRDAIAKLKYLRLAKFLSYHQNELWC